MLQTTNNVVIGNLALVTKVIVVWGRVIRYEEGKEAEIFTLVIKATVEENWFNNANVGKSFIEITEKELDEILLGKSTDNIEQDGKEMDLLFRL